MSLVSEAEDLVLETTTLVLNEPYPVVLRYLAGVPQVVLSAALIDALVTIQRLSLPAGADAADAAAYWRQARLEAEAE